MTGLGGGVRHALKLHQDLAEGSARHLLHLDVESLASPVSGIMEIYADAGIKVSL